MIKRGRERVGGGGRREGKANRVTSFAPGSANKSFASLLVFDLTR